MIRCCFHYRRKVLDAQCERYYPGDPMVISSKHVHLDLRPRCGRSISISYNSSSSFSFLFLLVRESHGRIVDLLLLLLGIVLRPPGGCLRIGWTAIEVEQVNASYSCEISCSLGCDRLRHVSVVSIAKVQYKKSFICGTKWHIKKIKAKGVQLMKVVATKRRRVCEVS